jgi:hypothetical protein
MSRELDAGDLAVVIPGKGGSSNIRTEPKIGHRNPRLDPFVKGGVPEHAVLAILPKPSGWTKDYPYRHGGHVWFYVRGRSVEPKGADGRFTVIEGWAAASENGDPFLKRMIPSQGCLDTMGTALDTHLSQGQQAYVLPAIGLNVRQQADPHSKVKGGLPAGTVVTVLGKPHCNSKMVWWQVKPGHWVSEGNSLEWLLAPLTLT